MEERRARARRGRQRLHRVGACMIPMKDGAREEGVAKAADEHPSVP